MKLKPKQETNTETTNKTSKTKKHRPTKKHTIKTNIEIYHDLKKKTPPPPPPPKKNNDKHMLKQATKNETSQTNKHNPDTNKQLQTEEATTSEHTEAHGNQTETRNKNKKN